MARVTHLNVNHRGADGDTMDADDIGFTPAGSISSTNVQAAIEEVATEGGIAEITDIPTAETDDTLRLAPDGAGGVEWAVTGSGYPWIDDNTQPDAYPGSPTSFDDEFTAGTIDAKWTITNDPGLGNDGGMLQGTLTELTTDNFDNLIRIHQAAPTGTDVFQFGAKVALVTATLATDFEEFATIGVYFGNSTNDEAIGSTIQITNDTAATTLLRMRGEQYTAGASAAVTTDHLQVTGAYGQWVYIMLYKSTSADYSSANTYSMWVSGNGIKYQQVGSMSKTFTTNCDEVGLYFRAPKAQTGTPVASILVDWFRQLA